MESYQKELVLVKKILKANPRGMTITDISRKINVNRNSVAKYLDILLISGYVEMMSIGPAKVFYLSHRIPLSAMLNFSSDYILVFDKDLKIARANDNILDFMKTGKEALLGKNIEDCPLFADIASKIKKALDGKDSAMEKSFKLAGKEFHFRIKLIPTTFEDGEPGATILAENITERKKVEEKIKESGKRYRLLLGSITDGVQVQDRELRYILVNKELAHMAQMSKEKLMGKKMTDLFPGVEKTVFFKIYKKVLETGEPAVASDEFVFKDGRKAWYEVHAYPAPEGLLVIVTDITKRKNAEKKLRESEEKYREIFELSPEAIGLLDKKGNILDMNGRVYDWLGYKPEEIIGKNILEVPFLTRESKTKIKENFAKRMLGEEVPPYEADFITKGRERVVGRILATPIRDAEGKIIQDLVMISEVTESKRAEEKLRESENKFRMIFENVNDMIIHLNKHGEILDINKRVEDILGYELDEVRGKNFAKIGVFRGRNLPKILKLFRDLVRENKSVNLMGVEVKDKKGNKVLIEASIRLIKKNGKVEGVVCIARNITERNLAKKREK